MAILENELDLLEKYLENGLDADERKAFEAKLANNDELKAEYQNRIYLRKLWLESKEYEDTKTEIKNAISQKNNNNKTRQLWIAASIAASIIILLGIYFLNNHNLSIREIESQKQYSKENIDYQNLQEDQPPSYAKLDSLPLVKLISPMDQQKINNNSDIVFKWNSTSPLSDTIFVYEALDDSLRIFIPVSLTDTVANISASSIGNGNFYWKFNFCNDKGYFIIY